MHGVSVRRIFDTRAIPCVHHLSATASSDAPPAQLKRFNYPGILVAQHLLRRGDAKCKYAETGRESEEIFDRR